MKVTLPARFDSPEVQNKLFEEVSKRIDKKDNELLQEIYFLHYLHRLLNLNSINGVKIVRQLESWFYTPINEEFGRLVNVTINLIENGFGDYSSILTAIAPELEDLGISDPIILELIEKSCTRRLTSQILRKNIMTYIVLLTDKKQYLAQQLDQSSIRTELMCFWDSEI